MEGTVEDLKNYIKLLKSLETLYNLYYEVEETNKYKRNILKKLVKTEYKKIMKLKKNDKNKDTKYFLNKANSIYYSINIKDLECDFNDIKNLIKFDKLLFLCKKKYKKKFSSKFNIENVDNVFCVGCSKEVKNKMLKYHVLGKKHQKNIGKEKFLCLKIDKKVLINESKKLIKKIIKEKNSTK
ncbi:uncharacterized protein VNE69_08128 [Vairimorpha necatrix]|uniref:U1-type domain-containing protein n=1 Tax=Vairimorpha necatrix TaxID=6039 RepID=A0AAX4JEW3_9MICR